jgi:hypothetical protein
MEHMVGGTVVQTRLSLGQLQKALHWELYMESGKREGGTMAQLYLTRANSLHICAHSIV